MDDLTSETLVKDIDHLGLVAGIIDQIGLVEEVDRRLGNHSQEHVTCGQVPLGVCQVFCVSDFVILSSVLQIPSLIC